MALPNLAGNAINTSYVGVLHVNGASPSAIPASGVTVVSDGNGNSSSLSVGRAGNGATVTGTFIANGLTFPGSGGGVTTLVDLIYPVGSIYLSVAATNPGTYFTGTTWIAIAQGKMLMGTGTGTDKNGNTFTGLSGDDVLTGEYTHQLTTGEMPAHSHQLNTLGLGQADGNTTNADQGVLFNSIGISGASSNSTGSAGGALAHNNIPPYFGVNIWQRTA
jgi:hypothetical protein